MKTLIRKFSRTAITVVLVILAFIAIFNAWVYYTESPWTRDARFSADVVAIAPDVSGLITQVNVHDNQLVKKGQIHGDPRASRWLGDQPQRLYR